MADLAHKQGWSLVITPRDKWFDVNIRELIRYRDLIWLFVKRDLAVVYKQTILGPLWFVIQPLVTTVVYSFVFGGLAKLSTDGVPRSLFYFGGTMLWHYFQITLLNVSDSFIAHQSLFGKVYFPRLTVPLSKACSNVIALLIQAVMLAILFVHSMVTGAPVRPTVGLLLFPLIVVWLGILAMGFGMIISSMTTKYRDLKHLLNFGMHLWIYATPVVYPMSGLPENVRGLMAVNPVSAPIELFRCVAYGTPQPAAALILSSLGATAVLFFLGLVMFYRNESTFVDVA